MKTIFNKTSVADMYIIVTQYDKMQRAFIGASPKLRFIGSFCFEILITFFLNSWIYNKKVIIQLTVQY